MQRTVRVGTRGSTLARTQTEWVVARLRERQPHLRVETRIIRTLADAVQDKPLNQFRERGVFVREIEHALLDGEIDFAVHSMKDLPSDLPTQLTIGAIPEREDPRDALVARAPVPEGEGGLPLPRGAVVGCSSLRRRAQLLHRRPDLRVVDLRGNVDTRLRKLESGAMDAIILAAAGLSRLGLSARVTAYLPEALSLPAVCQGALAVQCRADDAAVLAALLELDDPATRTCVTAERAVLAALGGGCAVPMGALARLADGMLTIQGVVAHPDGTKLIREACSGPAEEPERIGRELGERLLRSGGSEILAACTGAE